MIFIFYLICFINSCKIDIKRYTNETIIIHSTSGVPNNGANNGAEYFIGLRQGEEVKITQHIYPTGGKIFFFIFYYKYFNFFYFYNFFINLPCSF